MEKLLNVFMGNCVNASIGEWITLPMDEEELDMRLSQIEEKYGELIISSEEKLDIRIQNLYINQYADIRELNYVLLQDDVYKAMYIYCDEDMESTERILKKGDYLYVPNVTSTEELGEKLVEMRIVTGFSQGVIDMGYVDFEKIGRDFECNGIRLYSCFAIGQISKDNHKKWKKKLIYNIKQE